MPPKLAPSATANAIKTNISKLSDYFTKEQAPLNISVFGLAGSGKSSFIASVLFATGFRDRLPEVKGQGDAVTTKLEKYQINDTCIRMFDIYGLDKRVTVERFLKAMKGDAKPGHSFLDDTLSTATPDDQSLNQIDACVVFLPVTKIMMGLDLSKIANTQSLSAVNTDYEEETILNELQRYWSAYFFFEYVKKISEEGIPITVFITQWYKYDPTKFATYWAEQPLFALITKCVRKLFSEVMETQKASSVIVTPGVFYDENTLTNGLAYDHDRHSVIADNLLNILANQVLRPFHTSEQVHEEVLDQFKFESSIPVGYAGTVTPGGQRQQVTYITPGLNNQMAAMNINTPQKRQCTACNADNDASAKFCSKCGHPF